MSLFSVVSYRTELRKVSKFKSDWHISNFCGGGCFFSRWLDIRVVSSLSLSQAISVTIVYQFEKQCSFMVSFYGGIKLQVDICIYICLEKGFFFVLLYFFEQSISSTSSSPYNAITNYIYYIHHIYIGDIHIMFPTTNKGHISLHFFFIIQLLFVC